MQIHEITKKKKLDEAWGEDPITDLGQAAGKTVSGIKNVGGAIAAPFKDVAGGYKDARMDQKVSALTDKAYRAWKSYESQLLTTNPGARTDGQYEQALLAFVNKNLLGGMYLPNVINKDKITALVKQLSGSSGTPAAKQPVAKQPAAKQPAANAAAAGAFGQMTNQLGTTGASSTGGHTQATPTGLRHTANPNNPNNPPNNPNDNPPNNPNDNPPPPPPPPPASAKPRASFGKVPSATAPAKPGQMPASVATSAQGKKMQQASGKPKSGIQGMKSELEEATPNATTPTQSTPAAPTTPVATAPANEKDLFKQLVQQAGLAQTAAPGTGGDNNANQSNAKTKNAQGGNQDAQGMSQTLAQQLDPAIIKSLPVLSAKAAKLTGTNQVKSTGNPGADGLLILMGFRGL